MTYRERRARRAERLRGWAEKRQQKADASLSRAHALAESIPMGQPILVGHHSERRHRADLARIEHGLRQGLDHQDVAARMNSRADEIDRQAERSIYRDDDDAIVQLEHRIAGLEAQRERRKAINAEIRRGDGWEARITPPLTEDERAELVSLARAWAGVYKPGYPPYAIQNLTGNITRNRARLTQLRAERQEP